MDLFLIAVLEKAEGLLINFLLGSLFSLLLSDFLHKNCHCGIVLSSEMIQNIAIYFHVEKEVKLMSLSIEFTHDSSSSIFNWYR